VYGNIAFLFLLPSGSFPPLGGNRSFFSSVSESFAGGYLLGCASYEVFIEKEAFPLFEDSFLGGGFHSLPFPTDFLSREIPAESRTFIFPPKFFSCLSPAGFFSFHQDEMSICLNFFRFPPFFGRVSLQEKAAFFVNGFFFSPIDTGLRHFFRRQIRVCQLSSPLFRDRDAFFFSLSGDNTFSPGISANSPRGQPFHADRKRRGE